MTYLNRIANALFAVLLEPFEPVSPLVTLLVWSVIVGALMCVVFRLVSNQQAIKVAADQARANLLAIKLFQHDLNVTLRCQLGLLGAIALRLWRSLPPLAVMIVPLTLVLTQMGLRFEHTPVLPGTPLGVQLRLLPEAWAEYSDVLIEAPTGARVETPPL